MLPMSAIAFHEKAGRSQVGSSVFSFDRFFSSRRVATVAMLPSALSRSDFIRSVHVGRSRYSRYCHLFIALRLCSSEWSLGQAINAVTGTRLWAFVFSLPGTILIFVLSFVLCRCRQCGSAAVVQRCVRFPAHPQVMQQHRQLSCGGDDRSLLPALPAAFGQPQSPASQITVDAE